MGVRGPAAAAAMVVGSRSRLLVLLCLGYSASMLAFRPTLMLMLPTLTAEHGLAAEDAGLLISCCQLTYMVVKPLFQVVSDVAPAAELLIWSEVASSACFVGIVVARNRFELVVLFAGALGGGGAGCGRRVAFWLRARGSTRNFSARRRSGLHQGTVRLREYVADRVCSHGSMAAKQWWNW